MTTEDRFWAKVDKGGECWEWLGAKQSRGYGVLYVDGKNQLAHRVSLYIASGVWPIGHVRHSCDNPGCVNPEHLTDGTRADNMREMAVKNRCARTKLTPDEVREIRTSTLSLRKAAAKYGVDKRAIWALRNGETWQHVS